MKNVVIVVPDETIRRLLEVQLGLLGHRVAWSGDAPPAETPAGAEVALVDPGAPGALEFARAGDVPFVFVSALEPTSETRALAPRAHLTMPYGLEELAAAV
jgi:hypothetical protein